MHRCLCAKSRLATMHALVCMHCSEQQIYMHTCVCALHALPQILHDDVLVVIQYPQEFIRGICGNQNHAYTPPLHRITYIKSTMYSCLYLYTLTLALS